MFDFINAHDLPEAFKQGMPWDNTEKKENSKNADAKDDDKTIKAKKTISFANATPPSKKHQVKRRDVEKEEIMNVKRGGKDENLP